VFVKGVAAEQTGHISGRCPHFDTRYWPFFLCIAPSCTSLQLILRRDCVGRSDRGFEIDDGVPLRLDDALIRDAVVGEILPRGFLRDCVFSFNEPTLNGIRASLQRELHGLPKRLFEFDAQAAF
jgi:hypothetical protein